MAGDVATALQVTIGVLVAVLLLPYLLLRRDQGLSPFAALWRTLALGAAAWTALGFLLAAASSVELATIGLIFAFAVGLAAYMRRRRGSLALQTQRRTQQTAKLLDALDPEGEHSFLSLATDAMRQLGAWLGRALRSFVQADVLLTCLAVAVIAARQFAPLLAQAAPGTPEGYVQLLATKDVALNLGLYQSGVYPIAVPVLAALIATTFFFDPLNVLRFLGPLVALLLPLAGGFLAMEIADSGWAVFATVALIGFSVFPAIGPGSVTTWHPLALHFAAMFILAELAFSLRALRRESPTDASLAGVAGFVAVMAQPLAWPYAIGSAILLCVPWLRGHRMALRLIGRILLGSLIGLVPVAIGLVGHHAINALLMAPQALPSQAVPIWLSGWSGLALLLLAGAIAAVAALMRWQSLGDDAPLYLGIGLLLACLGVAGALPLQGVWRTPLVLGDYLGLLAVPLVVGYAFSLVANRLAYPSAAQGLAALAIAACLAVGVLPPQSLARYEVPGSEQVLQQISGSFEAYQWTVISPTEQYSELLGKGWHVELTQFLAKLPLSVARDARLKPYAWPHLAILTSDTFLYVPRVTADGVRPTAADLKLPVPQSLLAAENVGPAGAVLDAHAYAWAMAYHHAHPATSSIYYRNPELLVLWIRQ